jgi:hypothetical protein
MRFSSFSFLLALLIPVGVVQAQTAIPAGAAHYKIFQGDKVVGSSQYMVTPTTAGYTITSQGDLRLSKFSYDFNNTQYLDHMLNLVSDRITGTVNGSAVTFTVNADSTGRHFNINVNAKGKDQQNTMDRHQHLALLPDLDAAGYMLLTRVGLENPQVSWVLIPKETGLLVPTVYNRDADVQGRLNGRDITVQHTTVAVSAQNAINVELFYTPDGQLMEADLPQQNFYVVLDGFRMINRPKFAPPRSPEPNVPPPGSQQQQQQQPQQ